MRKEYGCQNITVSFDPDLCNHVGICLRELPEVFDRSRRPWVNPDQASPDRIAEVIMRCPTGALQFARLDGGPQEPIPEETTVTIEPEGPMLLRGNLVIKDKFGQVIRRGTRFTLCRCGSSRNGPFCDGTHRWSKSQG